eukprot:TRINITY_DN2611_c0_g1_i1.p1 TRINITY_DN2611_c0_g1~~TRINITY_DN2611_c0_g1_i1.p1  ORF type:complete len:335 (-),score=81.59 TRINITY_DN2611_c0_g1_i1:172-1176(-)
MCIRDRYQRRVRVVFVGTPAHPDHQLDFLHHKMTGFSSRPSFKDVLDDGPPKVLKVGWIIGVILLFINICFFVVQTVTHWRKFKSLQNESKPVRKLTKLIVQIVAMVPVFAFTSYIALLFMRVGPFFDLAQVFYEAWALWTFYRYIITLLGGPNKAKDKIGHELCSCFGGSVETRFHFVKYSILQSVFVHPILAFLTIVLQAVGDYDSGSWTANQGFPFITVANAVSSILCIGSLFNLYRFATKLLPEFSLGFKFVGIKFIVLCNVLQNIILGFLVKRGTISDSGIYPHEVKVDAIRNGCILVEITIIGILFLIGFKTSDLEQDYGAQPLEMKS